MRTSVASRAIVVARPSPIIFTNGDGLTTKLRKTALCLAAVESADAAVELAQPDAEEDTTDGAEPGVAEVAVQCRHRAGLDTAGAAVAHHQVVAGAQRGDEGLRSSRA